MNSKLGYGGLNAGTPAVVPRLRPQTIVNSRDSKIKSRQMYLQESRYQGQAPTFHPRVQRRLGSLHQPISIRRNPHQAPHQRCKNWKLRIKTPRSPIPSRLVPRYHSLISFMALLLPSLPNLGIPPCVKIRKSHPISSSLERVSHTPKGISPLRGARN